jgi:hypothetical protein
MKTVLSTTAIVLGMVFLRMLLANPAWFLLPDSWQRWLYGRSRNPFKTGSR